MLRVVARVCRTSLIVLGMAVPMAAHADQYDDFAVISSTLGVQDGRVCVGEASRGDIGCPAYAPYVATDGSISATRFVGDGSGLFNIAGASADRIVSGTTSMLAISDTGYISITQSGYNTAYFHPTLGLVAVGISTTGRISATDLAVRDRIDVMATTSNVLIGRNAGTNVSGSYVTALGTSAAKTSSGSTVVAIGNDAAGNNSGAGTVAVGNAAGFNNNAGYNVMMGYVTGRDNKGGYLTALGAFAAQNNSATYVTAVGYAAGTGNQGDQVTAVGYGAAQTNTGIYSDAFGYGALNQNTGSNVTGLGYLAARTNSGSYVLAVGNSAARANTGNHVTAIGRLAAYFNTGTSVTALGESSAYSNTYNNVTAIGYNAQPSKANQIVLGDPNIVEVTTSGVILAAGVSTTGTISATRFVGDGSGLFNISGASADRIVSGTTSMLAISDTGYISVTQSGVNTAYFHPSLGLVTVGVSSTGTISGTSGYFNAINIGPQPSTSTAKLTIVGQGSSEQGVVDLQNIVSSGARPIVNFSKARGVQLSLLDVANGDLLGSLIFRPYIDGGYRSAAAIEAVVDGVPGTASYPARLIFGTTGSGETVRQERMRISGNGLIAIGLTTPTTNLEVSGTVSATVLQVAATAPDSACAGASDLGKMRRNPTTGRMQVCR